MKPSPEKLAAIRDEVADTLIYLVELADVLDIDLIAAARDKIAKNAVKYPARADNRRQEVRMSFYKYHVFLLHQPARPRRAGLREPRRQRGSRLRQAAAEGLGRQVSGNVRINAAGCLGRCEQGPAIVVYPEGTWLHLRRQGRHRRDRRSPPRQRRDRRTPENMSRTIGCCSRLDRQDRDLRRARDDASGIALIAHPHPLFGGTGRKQGGDDARACLARSRFARRCARTSAASAPAKGRSTAAMPKPRTSARPSHTAARASAERCPSISRGFSFGAYVVTRLAKKLADAGTPARRLVLVAPPPATSPADRQYETEAVAPGHRRHPRFGGRNRAARQRAEMGGAA